MVFVPPLLTLKKRAVAQIQMTYYFTLEYNMYVPWRRARGAWNTLLRGSSHHCRGMLTPSVQSRSMKQNRPSSRLGSFLISRGVIVNLK